jgi:hypothetical protein
MSELPSSRHNADATTWTRAGYGAALVATAAIGYFLLRLPLDVSENILAFLSAHTTLGTLITRGGVFRPLGWLFFRGGLDGSFGHPFEGFRLLSILSLAGIFVCGFHILRVRTALSWGVALLTLVVMIGMHPFHQSVRETAVNHHLILACFLFCAVAIAVSANRWWSDPLAVLIMLCALLLMEAGVLVWVAIAVGWLTGLRGITWRGVAASTALVATYLVVYLFLLDAPSTGSRGGGFGFQMLGPSEVRDRFGANPLPLYVYNIMASVMTVLASEPRGGVFSFINQILNGPLVIGSVLNVVTSLLTTAVMIWFVVQRWRSWLALEFTHGDRVFLVGVAVLAANGVVSFPYLKEVVMTTGALAYALAVCPAFMLFVERLQRPAVALARAGLACTILAIVSVGWTARAALFFVDVQVAAYASQKSWVTVDTWIAQQQRSPLSEAEWAVVRQWRKEMLAKPVPRAYLLPSWIQELDTH